MLLEQVETAVEVVETLVVEIQHLEQPIEAVAVVVVAMQQLLVVPLVVLVSSLLGTQHRRM
jgi:hypothetical protein